MVRTPLSIQALGLALLVPALLRAEPRERSQGADPLAKARRAAVEVLVNGQLQGSGWIASPDGTVVTAAHVIWHAGKGKVEVINRELGRLPATIVASDPGHDLARLRILVPERQVGEFPYLEVAKSSPREGESVYFYGSALFRHWLAIRGSMSRAEPTYEYLDSIHCYGNFSFIAAPSPSGTSGGCWLDSDGNVIGNQTGFMNDNKGNPAGLALVAPTSAVRAIVTAEGDRTVASLGCGLEEVLTQSPGFVRRLPPGVQGAITVPIHKGRAAERAGLTKETLITRFEGKPITYRNELMDLVRSRKAGDQVRLTILSPDRPKPREITFTLGGIVRPTFKKDPRRK